MSLGRQYVSLHRNGANLDVHIKGSDPLPEPIKLRLHPMIIKFRRVIRVDKNAVGNSNINWKTWTIVDSQIIALSST